MTSSAPATILAPPSKSISHRKIIAAALAGGISHLDHVLECQDVARTMDVMHALGASIEQTGAGQYMVVGMGALPRTAGAKTISCFMGESGTTCRLVTAVLASGAGSFRVHGSPRLHERPIRELTDALTALGSIVAYETSGNTLPFVLHARGIAQPYDGSWLPVRCESSSQFLSGLLLAAPLATNGLGVILAGEKTVSWPYIGLTLQTLEEAGCEFIVETLRNGVWTQTDWRAIAIAQPGATRFRVFPGKYQPLVGASAHIEGDYSGASYFLAAGAAGPRATTVTNLRKNSLQGDAAILGILEDMGASVAWNGDAVTVSPGPLKAIDVDMAYWPDLVPTVAVLASFAKGVTRLTGVRHLRDKESDRLNALKTELDKIGCHALVAGDSLEIFPPHAPIPAHNVAFSAHNDHRIAMSLALLELAGVTASLDAPECAAKSFPGFWESWKQVCPDTRLARG